MSAPTLKPMSVEEYLRTEESSPVKAAYTALPSVQTYLIVEQNKRKVSVYQRRGGGWTSEELSGQGTITLPCLAHRLTLDEIYAGVLT